MAVTATAHEAAADSMQLTRELSAVQEQLGHAFAEQNDLHPTHVTALVAVLHAEAGGHPITAGDLRARLGMTDAAQAAVIAQRMTFTKLCPASRTTVASATGSRGRRSCGRVHAGIIATAEAASAA